MENPKLRGRESFASGWYKYYPGFSEAFARSILSTAGLGRGSLVLDPWNGSGTTTSTASALELNSVGCDLNPVMVVVAKARTLDPAEYPSLKPLSVDLLCKSKGSFELSEYDPLLTWLIPSSVVSIRSIEAAIQKLLIDDDEYAPIRDRGADTISDLAAYFYVALFRTLRTLLRSFYTSNPTWLKRPDSENARLRPSKEKVLRAFKSEIAKMLPKPPIAIQAQRAERALKVASSERLPLRRRSVDFILASPPYCTRIDYAVATWAELAVLGFGPSADFAKLRRDLIGSTTVPKLLPALSDTWGDTCLTFLKSLKEHSSKASSTYYYKNHLQYFASMSASVAEISRVLKHAGRCVLVVQDSYYKDLHTDLASIITQMASNNDLVLKDRCDFRLSRTMAGINPGSSGYRSSFGATESVLTFSQTRLLQAQ